MTFLRLIRILLGTVAYWIVVITPGTEFPLLTDHDQPRRISKELELRDERSSSPASSLVVFVLGGSPTFAAEYDRGDMDASDLADHYPTPKGPYEPRLEGIIYRGCPDAGRCWLTLPRYQKELGDPVLVRLAGIETPQLQGQCEREGELAQDAIDLQHQLLSDAVEIEIKGKYVVGLKLVAGVIADGQDLSALLVAQGLAMPYESGPIDWCAF